MKQYPILISEDDILKRNDVFITIYFDIQKSDKVESSHISKWVSPQIFDLYSKIDSEQLATLVEKNEMFEIYPEGTLKNVSIKKEYALSDILVNKESSIFL